MIFAIALASNDNPAQYFNLAYQTLSRWGDIQFSDIFQIPCRDNIGADYWNSACLLTSLYSPDNIKHLLRELEQRAGRIRPSHKISLDLDLIAWGETLHTMQLNVEKLPLALDVQIPLSQLWHDIKKPKEYDKFPIIKL